MFIIYSFMISVILIFIITYVSSTVIIFIIHSLSFFCIIITFTIKIAVIVIINDYHIFTN